MGTLPARRESGGIRSIVATALQEVGKRTGVSTDDVRCGIGIGEPDAPMYTLQAGAQHGVVATLVDGGRSHGAGDSYDNTPVVIAMRGREGGNMPEVSEEVPALRTPGGGSSHPLVMAFGWQNSAAQGASVSDEITPTLDKSKTAAVIVGNSGMESWRTTDTAITLAARDAKGANNVVVDAGRPRRLTPRECERLMGWPDDFTRYGVKEDGTRYELSDTARYRICGNGVGSPCAEWIARGFPAA